MQLNKLIGRKEKSGGVCSTIGGSEGRDSDSLRVLKSSISGLRGPQYACDVDLGPW